MNMKKMLFGLAVLALLPSLASAQEKVVLRDNEKTYTVEVVSADATAKTLTVKTNKGQSTLVVEKEALAGLQQVKPGETITITLRDAATGQRQAVTAIVSGTMSSRPTEPADEGPTVQKEAASAAQSFRLDPTTKRVTVIGDAGQKQVFSVDERSTLVLPSLEPGQKASLSYRFTADGKTEAVVRVTPAGAAPVVTFAGSSNVEVVSTDPAARTLTIRNDKGDIRTLIVDDRAAVSLKDLKPGDTVVVNTEGDKVVVITRRK